MYPTLDRRSLHPSLRRLLKRGILLRCFRFRLYPYWVACSSHHLMIHHLILSRIASIEFSGTVASSLFSSYSMALTSSTNLIDRRLAITTRSPHPHSVVWGYRFPRHSLRLSRRRMRSEDGGRSRSSRS